MAYFTGQEIVYYSGVPIWGMSYAGGVSQGILDKEMKNVYAFLGQALREIPIEAPFRGPLSRPKEFRRKWILLLQPYFRQHRAIFRH